MFNHSMRQYIAAIISYRSKTVSTMIIHFYFNRVSPCSQRLRSTGPCPTCNSCSSEIIEIPTTFSYRPNLLSATENRSITNPVIYFKTFRTTVLLSSLAQLPCYSSHQVATDNLIIPMLPTQQFVTFYHCSIERVFYP